MLSDRHIRNAKPGMHADGGGLYLRVLTSGKKVWVRRDRTNGKDTWKTIGHYPETGLAEARRFLEGGTDVPTSDAAIQQYVDGLTIRSADQVAYLLKPLRSGKLLTFHTRKNLVADLREMAERGPVLANRTLTQWRAFFGYCIQSGWLENNPLDSVTAKFVGGKEASREKVLNWHEISRLSVLPLTPSMQRAIYFILATGLRPSEALWVLRRKQFHDIPTKTTPRKLVAAPHIRALLGLPLKVPSSHISLSNALRIVKADFTPHDLRRTFATRMADLGVAPHVIEKMLHHKFEGVMAIYNRAEYWPEQVAAMRLWGRKLSQLRREYRSEEAAD